MNELLYAIQMKEDTNGESKKMVKSILDAGADGIINDPVGPKGKTSLMFAVDKGDLELVKLLMKYGADPRISDSRGEKAEDLTRNHKIKEALEKTNFAIQNKGSATTSDYQRYAELGEMINDLFGHNKSRGRNDPSEVTIEYLFEEVFKTGKFNNIDLWRDMFISLFVQREKKNNTTGWESMKEC